MTSHNKYNLDQVSGSKYIQLVFATTGTYVYLVPIYIAFITAKSVILLILNFLSIT